MYRTDIKQHRSLFTNQKFKEGSLALISSKKKIFFFFFVGGGGGETYVLLFAVPDVPSGERIVGQAVKEHPCLWEVFYEKKEGTAWFLDSRKGRPVQALKERARTSSHSSAASVAQN